MNPDTLEIRPIPQGDPVPDGWVELTDDQARRIEAAKVDLARREREAMLAARPHRSKGSRRRLEGSVIPEGFEFQGRGVCQGCRAPMNWARSPKGARTPLDPDGTNHFITCPDRDRFRRKK